MIESVLYVESDFQKMSAEAALAEREEREYGGTALTCRPRPWGICAKPQDRVRQNAMDRERGAGPAKKDWVVAGFSLRWHRLESPCHQRICHWVGKSPKKQKILNSLQWGN